MVLVSFGLIVFGVIAWIWFRFKIFNADSDPETVVIEFEKENDNAGDLERSSEGAGGSDPGGSELEHAHEDVRIFSPDLDSPDMGDLYLSQLDEFVINVPNSALVGNLRSKDNTFHL